MPKDPKHPHQSTLDQDAAISIAHLREAANDDDLPDWLRTSLNAIIDRMAITHTMISELAQQINDDGDTFINLLRTGNRKR